MRRPRDLADRMGRTGKPSEDGFRRETFTLGRAEARAKVREQRMLYPPEAYMTAIESWRELPGDTIEFTMKRLPTAD